MTTTPSPAPSDPGESLARLLARVETAQDCLEAVQEELRHTHAPVRVQLAVQQAGDDVRRARAVLESPA